MSRTREFAGSVRTKECSHRACDLSREQPRTWPRNPPYGLEQEESRVPGQQSGSGKRRRQELHERAKSPRLVVERGLAFFIGRKLGYAVATAPLPDDESDEPAGMVGLGQRDRGARREIRGEQLPHHPRRRSCAWQEAEAAQRSCAAARFPRETTPLGAGVIGIERCCHRCPRPPGKDQPGSVVRCARSRVPPAGPRQRHPPRPQARRRALVHQAEHLLSGGMHNLSLRVRCVDVGAAHVLGQDTAPRLNLPRELRRRELALSRGNRVRGGLQDQHDVGAGQESAQGSNERCRYS